MCVFLCVCQYVCLIVIHFLTVCLLLRVRYLFSFVFIRLFISAFVFASKVCFSAILEKSGYRIFLASPAQRSCGVVKHERSGRGCEVGRRGLGVTVK